jgi:hypothetical protein
MNGDQDLGAWAFVVLDFVYAPSRQVRRTVLAVNRDQNTLHITYVIKIWG